MFTKNFHQLSQEKKTYCFSYSVISEILIFNFISIIKSIILISILGVLFSCKKEIFSTNIDNKTTIDSTITAFQKKLLKQEIDTVFKKYHFNGSVAVFKDSIALYRNDNGFIDFKNKITIDSNSVFPIASISKQFTAVLILLQKEQGKLSLEDKVSQYLKEFQNKEYENITIHQLLNHTSGLHSLGGKLMFKSGTDFYYSNEGFNSLGKIIEKVSGKSYDENIMELFKKVRMNHSSTGNIFEGTNFASAYIGNTRNPEKVQNMPKRLGGKEIGVPAGGLLSTIDDLKNWNIALFNGKILKPETLKLFISKTSERKHEVFGKIGYGYGIMMNLKNPESFFHSGYIKGAPSLNIYYPKTKTSIIILSNIANEENGKNGIFKPHKEIKEITDKLENVIIEMNTFQTQN